MADCRREAVLLRRVRDEDCGLSSDLFRGGRAGGRWGRGDGRRCARARVDGSCRPWFSSRLARGSAGVSSPCCRAGLSVDAVVERALSPAELWVLLDICANHRRAAGAAACGWLLRCMRSPEFPPLHVDRDPGRRAAHPGGGGAPGFPRHRQRRRRRGAAGSRRERRPTRPRPSGDGAATRDLRARVQLAIAPAGSGKTITLRTLAKARAATEAP